MISKSELNKRVEEAVSFLKGKISLEPDVGMVLGSGLGRLVDEFEDPVVISFSDIPHFPVSSVEGHRGDMVIGNYCGKKVVALSGRVHFYENYTLKEVTFPVRVMAGLGINTVMLTNAGGGVNKNYNVGDIVLIKDHINFLGANPLKGAPDFIDLTDAYSSDLREKVKKVAADIDYNINEGVYLANTGPSYETPAEINMARVIGADIVGMSTVPAVIVAKSLGLKVIGLSMITNMAAGITGQPLSHEEVIETTRSAQGTFKSLVKGILEKL